MRRRVVLVIVLAVGVGLGAILAIAGWSGDDSVRSVPWGDGVVSEDGQGITVHFLGAAERSPGDPCHVDYALHVSEHADELVLSVRGRERNVSKFCTTGGSLRQLTARLGASLDGRRIVDGHDGRINAVRSSDGVCLQPPVTSEEADVPLASTTVTEAPPPPPTDGCDS